MATLADINKSLGRQENVLDRVEDNTHSTQKGINNFLKFLEGQKYKDLEAQREAGKIARPAGGARTTAGGGAAAGGGFSLPGLGLGAGAGLASLVGSGLVRRGIGSVLLYSFADEIVDHFFPNESELSSAQMEMKNMLEGGIKGGALGFLLGKRFAVIGSVVGALSQNETVRTEFGKLVDKLEDFGLDMQLLQGFATKFVNTIGGGLEGFNKLLEGEFDFSALDEMLLTVGGIALILAPGKTLGLGASLASRLIGFNKGMKVAGPKFKGKGRLGMLTAVSAALGLGYMSFGADGIDNGEGAEGDGGMDMFDAINTAITGVAYGSAGQAAVGQMESDKFARQQRSMDINQRSRVPAGTVDSTTGKKTGGQVKKFWYERYPKMAKVLSAGKGALKGLGIFGAMMAAFDAYRVYAILEDDTLSDEEKAKQIGPILGEALGAVGVAALGTVVGGLVGGPVGALVGGGIGGVVGAFGGNYAGTQLAKFMLGKGIEKGPFEKAVEQANRNVVASGQANMRLANMGIFTKSGSPEDVTAAIAQLEALGLDKESAEFKQARSDIVVGSQLTASRAYRASLMEGQGGAAYVGMYDNAMVRNAPPQQFNNIDQSVNAPTNNAVSIPATSSGQYDRYEAWLDERGSTPAFAR